MTFGRPTRRWSRRARFALARVSRRIANPTYPGEFRSPLCHSWQAAEAYHAAAGLDGATRSRARIAARLREQALAGSLDPSAVELVLGAVGHRSARRRGPAGLTQREIEVLVLIATGAAAKQVASALGIALKTATTHIERIYTKCGVSSRSEVTHFAIANGLVRPLGALTAANQT